MSSMRNTVQRRNHRERGQPQERQKWGFLEKHKDYSLRARDYGDKRARLKILRQKAADRNPDEFNYGMLSSRTNRGKKVAEKKSPSLGMDVVRLLKTQDLGYLQCMLQKTHCAIQRLEQEFVLRKGGGVDVLFESEIVDRGQHKILVEDEQMQTKLDPQSPIECNAQQEKTLFQVNDQENGETDADDEIAKKARHQLYRETAALKEDRMLQKRFRKGQEAQRRKLAALEARRKDLQDAVDELQCQRAKMSNNVGGITKDGLKWKPRERKG